MSGTGLLDTGFPLAANDEPVRRTGGPADAATMALICASRLGDPSFRILAAPGSPLAMARDARGVFQFVRPRG